MRRSKSAAPGGDASLPAQLNPPCATDVRGLLVPVVPLRPRRLEFIPIRRCCRAKMFTFPGGVVHQPPISGTSGTFIHLAETATPRWAPPA